MREDELKEKLKEIPIPKELDDRIKASIKQEVCRRERRKFSTKKKLALIAATFLLGIVMIKGYSYINRALANKEIEKDKVVVLEKKLPTIDNENKFKEIAKGDREKTWSLGKEKSTSSNMASAKMDASSTNNQVEGVDELDIVKTDGRYIFSVNRFGEKNCIYVTDSADAKNLKKLSTIEVKEPIYGLFLYNNKLILLRHGYFGSYGYFNNYDGSTKIIIYDYSNPQDIKLEKEIEVNGTLEESRLIDDELILVTLDYIRHENNGNPIFKAPYIIENGVKNEKSLKDIKYCPGFKANSFMNVMNFNLKNFRVSKSESMLVNGGNIYVSKDNMYLTNYDYEEDSSKIYKLSIRGEVKFLSEGKVKGKTLNQFSMDEYDGNLRIALTEQVKAKNEETTEDPNTINSVVVLDKNMKEIGRIGGLGKGEVVHSARFIEDRAYVVTFKQTDPLYVVDMSNPKNLTLLGELKTPGVSKYLHPIDDKTLIGFGEDRDETTYEGLKSSMFSVEGEPKELHTLLVKSKRSPVAYDHKRFFYSKKHNLMAFEMFNDYKDRSEEKRSVEVYRVDKEKGFSQMLSIPIEFRGEDARTLYIKDGLYVVTNNYIKVFNINTFEKIGEIGL